MVIFERDAEHFVVPSAAPRIRAARADEVAGYCRASFAEGFKQSSNSLNKLPWATYKRTVRPSLWACLDAATDVMVADVDGEIAGWIAMTRGRRVDTVHWLMTRLSRRGAGVARELVSAAGLRDRIVYTHRGVRKSDERIAKWLARRGAVSVVYEPYERWKL